MITRSSRVAIESVREQVGDDEICRLAVHQHAGHQRTGIVFQVLDGGAKPHAIVRAYTRLRGRIANRVLAGMTRSRTSSSPSAGFEQAAVITERMHRARKHSSSCQRLGLGPRLSTPAVRSKLNE